MPYNELDALRDLERDLQARLTAVRLRIAVIEHDQTTIDQGKGQQPDGVVVGKSARFVAR